MIARLIFAGKTSFACAFASALLLQGMLFRQPFRKETENSPGIFTKKHHLRLYFLYGLKYVFNLKRVNVIVLVRLNKGTMASQTARNRFISFMQNHILVNNDGENLGNVKAPSQYSFWLPAGPCKKSCRKRKFDCSETDSFTRRDEFSDGKIWPKDSIEMFENYKQCERKPLDSLNSYHYFTGKNGSYTSEKNRCMLINTLTLIGRNLNLESRTIYLAVLILDIYNMNVFSSNSIKTSIAIDTFNKCIDELKTIYVDSETLLVKALNFPIITAIASLTLAYKYENNRFLGSKSMLHDLFHLQAHHIHFIRKCIYKVSLKF